MSLTEWNEIVPGYRVAAFAFHSNIKGFAAWLGEGNSHFAPVFAFSPGLSNGSQTA